MSEKIILPDCPVTAVVKIIGGKYKPVILWHLANKTMRFGQLSKSLSNTTTKMLTQQLRELEKDGIINRKVFPVVPPKTEYSLTILGRTLIPILDAMCTWGRSYMEK